MRRRFTASKGVKEAFDYNDYLTIEALEDDFSVSFTSEVEYGIDGVGWAKLRIGTSTPIIGIGHIISFRGNLTPNTNMGVGRFTMNKSCNLLGNVMSILVGDKANNIDSLSGYDYAFYSLFQGCSGIKSVSGNFLPATTLASYCYNSMFYGCTGLTQAPELPATTLASSCYNYMFYGCTGLTQAPELPATTLASYCYNSMFQGCTNLNYIKALFTTTPSSSYTNFWVYNVASTGTFVKSKDATWDVTGADGVPVGWTVITE